MSEPFRPPPEAVARVRAFAERELTPEAFNAWVNAPMDDFEREELHALHAWFIRRYPTPAARLEFAQRAWADWAAGMPREPEEEGMRNGFPEVDNDRSAEDR